MYIEDEAAYNATCAAIHPNFHGSGYNVTCVEEELAKDITSVMWGIGMLRYDSIQYQQISMMTDAARKRNLIDLSIKSSAIGVMPYDAMSNLAGPRPCITVTGGVFYNTCVGKGTHDPAITGGGPVIEQVSTLQNSADLRSLMAQLDFTKLSRLSSMVDDCVPTGPGGSPCGPSFRSKAFVPNKDQFRTLARSNLNTEEGGVTRLLRRYGWDPVKAGIWADGETYGRSRPYAAHACITRTVQRYSREAAATSMSSESVFSDIDKEACVACNPAGDGGTYESIHRYNGSNKAALHTDSLGADRCYLLRRLAEYRLTRQQLGFEFNRSAGAVEPSTDPDYGYNTMLSSMLNSTELGIL